MKLKLLIVSLLFSVVGWGQSVIISQYIETNSGTTPKGIEIFNVSGTDIVFSGANNLQVYQGSNGGACTAIAATNITSGVLRANEVWVIGTSDLTIFANANGSTLSGTTTYAFTFNGDDALQIRLGGVLQDQFGNCGSDPGTAWTGGGVSTADNNLQVLDGLCVGDTDGWTNPSERFTQIANGSTMTGFGNAPAPCGSVTPPSIVLNSLNPSVAASNMTQATTNNVIYAFNLGVTSANATLNAVDFTTSGTYAASNITNFKLWYSADATFSAGTDTMLRNLTTGLGTGAHSFASFTQSITNGSTGYFFITADIPCVATVGNDLTVSAITTGDLTFVSGNKSGTAFASGIHTIAGATPNNVTGVATANCQNAATTVNWTAPAGCYDNVLVFVSTTPFTAAVPTGNGGAYTANTVFGSGTSFDGGFTVYKGTGNSVTVTGLTNGTTYYYKIFTRNGLLWSSGATVNCTPDMAYCASGATNTIDSEIENVTLVGETTTIANNTANACTTGVNNYTAMSADLQVGGTYTLTVEFGDCNGGSQYNGAGGVWIDWNNDGDFDDANEVIGTENVAVSGGNVVQNFSITVPAGQPLGSYRMRIVQHEGASSGTISPCGTFGWGSTEDYTIVVVNACTPTTSVSSITPASGPVGTVVTLNGTGFTTATALQFGGTSAAFTVVSDTVLEAVVPANGNTGNILIQDAGGCDLSYSSFTVISEESSTCEGAFTSDLIIYDIHDEKTGSGGFITLYNGTAATVDLTNYSIWRTSNHDDGNEVDYANLTGTIAPGALAILKVSVGSCGPASTNGTIDNGFNENDGIQLRNAAGTVVIDDVDTYPTAPGYYMVRNAGALTARPSYVAADWSTIPLAAGECYPSAGLVLPTGGVPPSVTTQPAYSSSCGATAAVLTTAGTEGFAGGNGLAYQWYVAAPGSATWSPVPDGGIYSGATTASLSISAVAGVVDYQYYCQIRENSVTCFTASNAIKITDAGTTTWSGTAWSNGTPNLTKTAIINGDFTTGAHGNFSCCSLVVNAGFTLAISSNGYVEIQNNINNAGNVVIENDGQLIQINETDTNAGTYTGTAFQVKRTVDNLRKLDYVYWSAPVENFNISGINGSLRYYWNTTAANPNGTQGYWLAASGVMAKGQGYIVRGPNTFATPQTLNVNFTGKPFNGQFTYPISRGTDAGSMNDNLILVGNPYPSAIDADAFLAANLNIEGAVHIWTHGSLPSSAITSPFYQNFASNYSMNDYIVYNGTATTLPAAFDGKIASGQGFFIKMNEAGAVNQTITFNNAMRGGTATGILDNTQFFRTAGASEERGVVEKNRIWLDLVNAANQTSTTVVGYVTGATMEKDNRYDAYAKLNSGMCFYSMIGEEAIHIQGRALPFEAADKVPMGMEIPTVGNYTIAIRHTDGLFAGNQHIYLEDRLLQIIHDLKANPYAFTIDRTGFINDRFVLRFTNQTLGQTDFETVLNAVTAYGNEGVVVKSPLASINEVVVYDVLGRIIAQKKNAASHEVILPSVQPTQSALIVKITLENGQVIDKKILY